MLDCQAADDAFFDLFATLRDARIGPPNPAGFPRRKTAGQAGARPV